MDILPNLRVSATWQRRKTANRATKVIHHRRVRSGSRLTHSIATRDTVSPE